MTNPANHEVLRTFRFSNKGFSTFIVLGKASESSSVRPLLRLALIATIFCSPSTVKCSLFRTKSNALLQS